MSYFKVYSLSPLSKTCRNHLPVVTSSATYCLSQRSSSNEGPKSRDRNLLEHCLVSSPQEWWMEHVIPSHLSSYQMEKGWSRAFLHQPWWDWRSDNDRLLNTNSFSILPFWILVKGDWSRAYAVMSDDWPRPQSSEMIHSIHQSCGDVIRLFLSKLPGHPQCGSLELWIDLESNTLEFLIAA